ncbi:TP53 regulating kinase [Desmophyllum pertusum]|uniref:non-specific serine/threonine protein kinase n=1 Tax=Desmophyllum pertusum TaxID=174260 RepID=A0A9W9Z4H5_9CNID|nr:TP53 regulating kinase [Desmophyllum pertusum]
MAFAMEDSTKWCLLKQGAEARVYKTEFYKKKTIIKERFTKSYRHPSLDEKLTHRRTNQEVRSMLRCRKAGICTPAVYFVDYTTHCIYMEEIENCVTARDHVNNLLDTPSGESEKSLQILAEKIGFSLAAMHNVDCVHGDLTTSNILIKTGFDNIILIDFGLSFVSQLAEDKGVDLYVLERAFLSTHPNTEQLFKTVLESYRKKANKAEEIIKKLDEIRMRGRKRTMVG